MLVFSPVKRQCTKTNPVFSSLLGFVPGMRDTPPDLPFVEDNFNSIFCFIGCAVGGLVSRRAGSERVAAWQLATSGLCCLLAPWMLDAPTAAFIAWLVVWGLTVVGDSPQFSALTARNAPPGAVGSVLTFTNCVGFAISVVSIELFVRLGQVFPLSQVLPWLAVGPALGLIALRPLLRR